MVSNDMLSTLMKLSVDLGSNQAQSKLQSLRSTDKGTGFSRMSKSIRQVDQVGFSRLSKTIKYEAAKPKSDDDLVMNEEHWRVNVLADEIQGALYRQLEADFDFNVVVLGDSKVGKTSLIQSYVNGGPDLVRTRDSDGMYEMLNIQKSSPTREIRKHKVEL